jgi:hypothetical protein
VNDGVGIWALRSMDHDRAPWQARAHSNMDGGADGAMVMLWLDDDAPT